MDYSRICVTPSGNFVAVGVITLAVGIGANTANVTMGYEWNPSAAGSFRDWRDRDRVFEQLAASTPHLQSGNCGRLIGRRLLNLWSARRPKCGRYRLTAKERCTWSTLNSGQLTSN